MDFSKVFLPLLLVILAVQSGETREAACSNLVDHPCRCEESPVIHNVRLLCGFANQSMSLDGIKRINPASQINTLQIFSDEIEEFPSGLFENFNLYGLELYTPKLRVMQSGCLGNKTESRIYSLLIRTSNLPGIPMDTLKSTKKLWRLHVDTSSLRKIDEEICKGMECGHTLEVLSLVNNSISKVERGAFTSLKNLKRLILRFNKLTSLSVESFGDNIKTISFINLGHNNFTSLPSNLVAKMSLYSSIFLYKNDVTTISKADLNLIVKRKVYVLVSDVICNCDFEVIAKQNEMSEKFLKGTCSNSSSPKFLAGLSILELHTKDFAACHV